jgi:hypothetical protein
MRAVLAAVGFLTLCAAAPAFAQGTPEQRAACTDDAFRFCNNYVPDAAQVEACLRGYLPHLSPACRAQFADPATPGKKGRKRR